MSITLVGPAVVAVFVFAFGAMLFRGMVHEWHRRDQELRRQAH